MARSDTSAPRPRLRALMLRYLAAWLIFGFVAHLFVVPLNRITVPVLGFPLGYYVAAQGALIIFVVMLFSLARQQERIEREHDD